MKLLFIKKVSHSNGNKEVEVTINHWLWLIIAGLITVAILIITKL